MRKSIIMYTKGQHAMFNFEDNRYIGTMTREHCKNHRTYQLEDVFNPSVA